MTNVSYDNLDTLIGELKQAAIDAWMKTEDPAAWNVNGDKYEDNSSVDTTVTRPGSDGEGGGNWDSDVFGSLFGLHDRDEEYQQAFANVRTRIDNAVNKWKQLPNPDTIGAEVEEMRQASRLIALSSITTEGRVTGSSNIVGNLNGIQENSTAMAGGTIAAFKSKFLLQLGRCIAGQHAITMILGGALVSQQKMWESTRKQMPHVVNNTTVAMRAVAGGGENNWSGFFEVAGWVVKGVGLFTGGATDPIVDGLDILKEATATEADDKAEGGGGDYESVMKSFEDALDDLAHVIRLEENDLRTNLTGNQTNVGNDRGSYDLSAAPLLGGPNGEGAVDEGSDLNRPGDPAVIIEPSLVKEITATYLPAIAADLGSSAQKAYAAQNWGAYSRDGSIGIGATGPSAEWFDLDYLLYELVKQLEWEVQNGAITLDLAVADLLQTDAGVAGRLEEHAEKVKQGSIFDPWN